MTSLPRRLISSSELIHFAQFLGVGILSTLLDFSLLTILKQVGTPTLMASSLGYLGGLCWNYLCNSHWTFSSYKKKGLEQFVRFTCISLVGLVMNDAIVLGLEAPLGRLISNPLMGYLPSKFIATGIVVFWNYLGNRAWTFKVQHNVN